MTANAPGLSPALIGQTIVVTTLKRVYGNKNTLDYESKENLNYTATAALIGG